MTAYSDAAKIAAHLGVTLTASQITQAGVVAQAASDWIDKYTDKSWQGASPVTDELHSLANDRVYLSKRPVAAVSVVKTRASTFVGFGWTTLSASQYELLDAQNGVLLISGWGPSNTLVQVTYTHTATTAPPVIRLAADMIAASWLGPTMVGLPSGLDSIALGQNDINVKFSKDARDVPPEALSLLASYRSIVVA